MDTRYCLSSRTKRGKHSRCEQTLIAWKLMVVKAYMKWNLECLFWILKIVFYTKEEFELTRRVIDRLQLFNLFRLIENLRVSLRIVLRINGSTILPDKQIRHSTPQLYLGSSSTPLRKPINYFTMILCRRLFYCRLHLAVYLHPALLF